MRFMVLIKADKNSEAGVLPDEKLLREMGNYNDELVKAGVMLAGEGLQPSSKGARVRFSGDKRTVIDGPFAETKELHCRLLDLQGEFAAGSDRLGEACPEPVPRDGIRDRDQAGLRSSKTSARNSLRNFAHRKSAAGGDGQALSDFAG